jgi:hypothetical protein
LDPIGSLDRRAGFDGRRWESRQALAAPAAITLANPSSEKNWRTRRMIASPRVADDDKMLASS